MLTRPLHYVIVPIVILAKSLRMLRISKQL